MVPPVGQGLGDIMISGSTDIWRRALIAGVSLGFLAACQQGGEETARNAAAVDAGFGERCAALEDLAPSGLPDETTVLSTRLNEASAAVAPSTTGPGQPALPRHCEVTGSMQKRQGADGQTYAIKFRLRLPEDWNGRFLYEGSGGSNGTVGNAWGPATEGAGSALETGYAVISQDSGHDNATNSDPERQGTAAFGHDFEARRNYGYASYAPVAETGKALITAFYGHAAGHSYFAGCSNGGREGMVFAQKYPAMFDGIVAAAPGFSLPKAAVTEAWDTQALARAAEALGRVDEAGRPQLNKAFSDEDLAIVSDAVLEACDALDGLEDGMVNAFPACTTQKVDAALAGHICQGEKAEGCLAAAQVAALKTVYAGPHNSKGEALYASWPWDRGMGGRMAGQYDQGWRAWKLGGYDGMPPYAINILLGAPSLSAIFITPPEVMSTDPGESLDFLLSFDFDEDAPKIFATSPAFPESAWDMTAARSADLSAFREHGGKIIVPHGASDPVFSINDTLAWWEELNEREGGDAAEFARVYPVPGMTHCRGGAATDQYDALKAVVDWVEKDAAPDHIQATAGASTPWPGRTRPLCPYPGMATYTGSGSIEDAASFTCETQG